MVDFPYSHCHAFCRGYSNSLSHALVHSHFNTVRSYILIPLTLLLWLFFILSVFFVPQLGVSSWYLWVEQKNLRKCKWTMWSELNSEHPLTDIVYDELAASKFCSASWDLHTPSTVHVCSQPKGVFQKWESAN